MSDTPILAIGGFDQNIRLYSAHKKDDLLRTIPFSGSQVNALSIPSTHPLLGAVGHSTIKIYDLDAVLSSNNTQPINTYQSTSTNITSIQFELHKNWFATSSEDGAVRIWDMRTPGTQLLYQNHSIPINTLSIHPDQSQVFFASQSGTITCWDLVANKIYNSLQVERNTPIQALSVSNDGDTIYSGNYNGLLCSWSNYGSRDGGVTSKISGHGDYILQVRSLGGGGGGVQRLVSSGADGMVCVWTLERGGGGFGMGGHSRVSVPVCVGEWIWSVCGSCDGEYFFAGGSRGEVGLYESEGGERLGVTVSGGEEGGVLAMALYDVVLDRIVEESRG